MGGPGSGRRPGGSSKTYQVIGHGGNKKYPDIKTGVVGEFKTRKMAKEAKKGSTTFNKYKIKKKVYK